MNCSPLIRWISSLCEVPTGCKPVASKRKQLFCGAGGLGYGDATARPFFFCAPATVFTEKPRLHREVSPFGASGAPTGATSWRNAWSCVARIRFREPPAAKPTVRLAVSTYDEGLMIQMPLLAAQVTP